MKKIVLFVLFIIAIPAVSQTINWYVDDSLHQTTTCESGNNLTPPSAPAKTGYTFQEWRPYRELQYVESNGTQYLNTGYRPTTANVIEIKYRFLQTGNMGTSNGWFSVNQSTTYISVPGGYGVRYIGPNNTLIIKFDAPNNRNYVNGNSYGYTASNASSNFFVFASNSSSKHSGRFYYMKIWENDILVRDMIPALDDSGAPCIYDRVQNRFYYKNGTDDLIAGPLVE